MRYISMFSGIEAASVAFGPLGWEPICFAEIEPFPSAVLAHHYPETPNVGDMTAHDWARYRGACDLVVGGPPCQAFSVAGLRQSLADDRGNLSLSYMRAIHAVDPLWCITENVPGWLSTGDNAFGCFLAGLVGEDAPLEPTGGRWTDAGVVAGPRRTAAWRILDAQYFGVPQRRRRVFVLSVRGAGNWACAAALFSLADSLSGNPPPRREAGEGVAGRAGECIERGGDPIAFDPTGSTADPGPIAQALRGVSGGNAGFHCGIAHSLRADGFDASEDGTGRGTPLVPVAFNSREDPVCTGDRSGALGSSSPQAQAVMTLAVRGRGDSHDLEYRQDGTANAILTPNGGRAGIGVGAVAFNVTPSHSNKDYNARPSERSQAITSNGNRPSARGGDLVVGSNHADAEKTRRFEALRALRVAIGAEAFAEWQAGIESTLRPPQVLRSEVHGQGIRREADEAGRGLDDGSLSCAPGSSTGALREVRQAGCERRAPSGRGLSEQLTCELGKALSELSSEGAQSASFLLDLRQASEGAGLLQSPLHPAQGRAFAVRRLTPREAERLQGFPDDYTLVPYRSKSAADGPRYRALGNSMAVPVMRWIGERIEAVRAILAASEAA